MTTDTSTKPQPPSQFEQRLDTLRVVLGVVDTCIGRLLFATLTVSLLLGVSNRKVLAKLQLAWQTFELDVATALSLLNPLKRRTFRCAVSDATCEVTTLSQHQIGQARHDEV